MESDDIKEGRRNYIIFGETIVTAGPHTSKESIDV